MNTETTSVSKGLFLFKNGFKKNHLGKKRNKCLQSCFTNLSWHKTFKTNWDLIEHQLQNYHNTTYSVLLNDIVNYVGSFYNNAESVGCDGIIPSATLLTGVNQPDHVSQFKALSNMIIENVTKHVVVVSSQDAPTVKNLVENVVWQFCNEYEQDKSDTSEVEQLCVVSKNKKIKKSYCTMKTLQHWYNNKYTTSPKKRKSLMSLVVIIPDFESFNSNILQDFVMIVSSYALPIILVFGVATSVSALHKSFPYHVSSKLQIKVFHSHSSPVYMNQVLENVFLNHTCPFQLSGKALELLTDVFLFYDFSVTGLVQSIKYCMMEHYYGDNIKTLCCGPDNINNAVENLTSDDLESIRQLLSFRPFVEAQDCKTKIALFEDDDFFKETLLEELNKLHEYLYSFYACIKLLAVFVMDLPRNVLGKTIREIYGKCASENITDTQSFRECMQLINFQSQVKLVDSIKNALKTLNTILNVSPSKPLRLSPAKLNYDNVTLEGEFGKKLMKTVKVHLMMFLRQIEESNTEATVMSRKPSGKVDTENVYGSRHKLKEKLLRATREDKVQSEFEMIRGRFVSYLDEMFKKGLDPPHNRTFHEILFFNDVSSVKKVIIGAPRGAIHTALSNPYHYLQCTCCRTVSAESVSGALPDVCIAYKLHRECGRHVNLYDWLQAFAAVLPASDHHDHDQLTHDPTIQLRFSRAVSELQFLGFIKTSKRKTDHVMRLTW